VFYPIICNENYLTSVETVSGHDLATIIIRVRK
jgi:hypothetical protein